MTSKLKSVKDIVRKVGGVRKLIFCLLVGFLGLTLLLDIFVVAEILAPLIYLYIALGIIVVLYGIPFLYSSRRLIQYCWQRTRGRSLSGKFPLATLALPVMWLRRLPFWLVKRRGISPDRFLVWTEAWQELGYEHN